jgi:hypothetical protein
MKRLALFTAAALAVTVSASAQYSVSGPGGAIPDATTTGNAGTVLPGSFAEFTLTTPVPATALNIRRVKLTGLTHTWPGDLQFVLVEPGGAAHNLVSRLGITSPTATCCGFSCDVAADWTISETDPGTPWPASCSTAFTLVTGTYPQYFGAWVSGSAGVSNTLMSAIPAAPGLWKLRIYDGAGGDVGALTSFTIEGDSGPAGPVNYCTAGTSTTGCQPTMSGTANLSATFANPCSITASGVDGQKFGILFYSVSGQNGALWCATSTSYLCVKAPTQRTPSQSSGGTAGLCDGSLTLDVNAYMLANPSSVGQPFAGGNVIDWQGWYRDPPACKTTQLTDGLSMTVQP